ncbi:MAG: GNAT family N-acetyltransferase [Pseudomonadota bacterium]
MIVREAIAEDFARIMELYAQLHPEDPVIQDGSDRRIYADILANPNLHVFVLQAADGALNATCYLNFIPNLTRKGSPYCVIENVVTEASLRNQGLGKKLLLQVLQFAWNKGCYKVMLQTGSRQASTHNFYKSCGFSADDKFAFVARPPE